MFSVVAIALSCAAISKNNTIAEKEDQLSQQKNQISIPKEQLSNKEAEVKAHKQKISEENDQTAVKNVALSNQVGIAEENSPIQEKPRTLSPKKHVTFNEEANQVINIKPDQEEFIDSHVNRIVKDGSRDACNAIPSANSIKEISDSAYDTSVKYTKSVLTSVGTFLQSVCDVIAHPTANLKKYF